MSVLATDDQRLDKQLLGSIEPATGNYLRPNSHGGYLIRQSDLSSWSRCQMQKFYDDRAKADPAAPQPRVLSATMFGTVMHYALLLMEQAMYEGRDNALDIGLQTFEYYWNPDNVQRIPGGAQINEWLPRETYGGLRERGRRTLRDHYDLLSRDESWVLALEYQFAVPLEIGGRVHTLTGTVDRLAIRKLNRKPYVSLDDNKTGKTPTYLRWNMQGTAYCFASTQRAFWTGWAESGMGALESFDAETIGRLDDLLSSWGYRLHNDSHREGSLASRRFRWIDLKNDKFVDGGWRNARDYARLHLAVDSYVRACEAEVYAINTTGEVCRYCPYRTTCGGVALPDEEAGAP